MEMAILRDLVDPALHLLEMEADKIYLTGSLDNNVQR